MLAQVSTRQFNEWRDYADLEPFDEKRADLRAASIVQALVNLLGRRKGQPAVKLEECALRLQEKQERQSREQLVRMMTVIGQMYGAEPETPRLLDASGRPIRSAAED